MLTYIDILENHMAGDPVDDLRNLLSYKMLGHTNLTGYEPEAAQIDFLCDIVRGWGMGDYSIEDIKLAFKKHPIPDFDILSWIQSKVDSGDYDPIT